MLTQSKCQELMKTFSGKRCAWHPPHPPSPDIYVNFRVPKWPPWACWKKEQMLRVSQGTFQKPLAGHPPPHPDLSALAFSNDFLSHTQPKQMLKNLGRKFLETVSRASSSTSWCVCCRVLLSTSGSRWDKTNVSSMTVRDLSSNRWHGRDVPITWCWCDKKVHGIQQEHLVG